MGAPGGPKSIEYVLDGSFPGFYRFTLVYFLNLDFFIFTPLEVKIKIKVVGGFDRPAQRKRNEGGKGKAKIRGNIQHGLKYTVGVHFHSMIPLAYGA